MKKALSIAKDLSEIHKLGDIESIDFDAFIQSITVKIHFVCFKFHENEELANRILMDLIPVADIEDLVVIFNRVTIYSDRFIQYCKEYANVNKLRPAITQIFRKLRINCEEAGIFTTEITDGKIVGKVLECVNTPEFKRMSGAIASILEKNVDLLPEISEIGYRNLRSIKMLHLFKDQLAFNHPSEAMRIEYLTTCSIFDEIYEFLRFNQFIYSSVHRKLIKKILSSKISTCKSQDSAQKLYDEIVLKMCKSLSPIRRHLGVCILELLDIMPDQSLALDLIYDVTSEIREDARFLCRHIDVDYQRCVEHLCSHEYEKIYGASILLSCFNPEKIFGEFKARCIIGNIKDDSVNCDGIYGIMSCLNRMKYSSEEYTSIVNTLYSQHKSLPTEHSWRIMRECCIYYRMIEMHDLLMDILLETDHMGLIFQIRDLVDSKKIDLERALKRGIQEIRNKKITTRKSGGVSQYFATIISNRNNYSRVRDTLHSLITTDTDLEKEGFYLIETDENIAVHALNAFVAVFDRYSDDFPFYFRLGFACLEHSSFSIKNCGIALLGSFFKKILISQKTFDDFFLGFKSLRKELNRILKGAIEKQNKNAVYFALFIYENTLEINDTENALIDRSQSLGELIQLKARRILEKSSTDTPRSVSSCLESSLKSLSVSSESEIIARVLIKLNENKEINENERNRLSIPEASREYQIHRVVAAAKSKRNEVLDLIDEYKSKVYANGYDRGVYNPALDFSYITELLYQDD